MVCVWILTGCVGSHIQQTHFYSLNEKANFKSSFGEGMTIGIGPIYLADHLDRPNLVRQTSTGKYLVYNTYRWKAPLDEAILLGLAHELKARSPDRGVVMHPWYRGSSIDYQVVLRIQKFEPDSEGQLTLTGSFEVIDKKKNSRIKENDFEFELKMSDHDFSNQVKLMREAIRILASEINRSLPVSFSIAGQNAADD